MNSTKVVIPRRSTNKGDSWERVVDFEGGGVVVECVDVDIEVVGADGENEVVIW